MNMSDQRQLLDMQRVKPPRVRTAFRGLNVKAETYHGRHGWLHLQDFQTPKPISPMLDVVR